MLNDRSPRHDRMLRLGGLIVVALIGLLLAACGLSLSFARYRLSMFFFFAALALLVVIRAVVWRLGRRASGGG